MKQKTIVLIGAGSAMFTQGLIVDLINQSDKVKWNVRLVDIDPEALDSVFKLSKKMIAAKKSDIDVSASTDRKDMLPGADYIVTTIGVGKRRAWEQDVLIPRKYGIYQPVGDTVMPGGISRAMRMIPALIDIARDIEKFCPNAYFFNYSNPMAMVCRAMYKSGFDVVGLCHGINQTEEYLAKFMGVERSAVRTYGVGLNHLTFIHDIRYNGKDAKPLILEKYAKLKNEGIKLTNSGKLWFDALDPDPRAIEELRAFDFMEKYNAYLAPGDRHTSEFLIENFPDCVYYDKKFGIEAYSFERCIEFGDKIYDDMVANAQSDEPLPASYFDEINGEHEQLLDIIDAIENDKPTVFSMNLPNKGAVPNLPEYSVLEMPALANARGASRIMVDDYPDVFAGIVNKHLSIVEVAVDAALTGSRDLMIESILMGGYMPDRDAVASMVDELLQAQKQYLPQFKNL